MINKTFKKFILYLQIVIIVIFSLAGCIDKDKSTKLKGNNVIPHGFGVSMHGDLSKQDIQRMREAKIKWVRIDVTWQEIETKKGHYNFERYDRLNDTLKENNIRPYYILDYSNRLYEKRTSIVTEKGRNAFSNYVKAVVQRYKNQNGVWEIWNEPNHKSYWNDQPSYKDYSLLVEKVAPLIKRYDKSGLVVAPALSGAHTEALQWLENVFKNPKAISSIDAISVHPYNNIRPETVLEDYKKLRNLIKKYSNKPLPIFSGEWGFAVNTYSENFIIDEQKQAEFLVRMLLLNASQNIPVSIWYDWRNDGENPNNKEHNFGLLTNDYQPKLSYYAYANLTKLLNGYSFNKRITTNINQNDFIFEFIDKEENKIIIFWSTNNTHSLTVSIPSGEGKFVTLYGKEKQVNWTNNQIQFQISTTPTYLVIKK